MIIIGNSLQELKNINDNSIDSVVTDPPYGLSFMGKKWDYDVPTKELWQEVFRVLKPGGHLLAFAGTRTQHRMAVNIEDAGFEIRDMIAWVYGSGFPKSLNIGKAVDKLQGNEREVTGTKNQPLMTNHYGKGLHNERPIKELQDTKGNSPYEGWGTALKPALEPITVARKPISEKNIAQNVLKWGTGGVNIDGCRVKTDDNLNGGGYNTNGTSTKNLDEATSYATKVMDKEFVQPTGRFPANLILSDDPEVEAVFPQTKSGAMNSIAKPNQYNTYGKMYERRVTNPASEGSAARFFYCAKSSRSERNRGLDSTAIITVQYNQWNDTKQTHEAKEAKLLVAMDTSQQRVTGVSGIETKNGSEWNTLLFGSDIMEKYPINTKSTTSTTTSSTMTSAIYNWLIGLLTNEYTAVVNSEMESGGNHAENAENYSTLTTTINEKMVSALGVKGVQSGTPLKINVKDGSNFHSTVKPVKLMQYLVKLVTPKGGTVLDPFNGSGTTGIACKLEGFDYIGIELDPEYVKISEARIAAWKTKKEQLELVS